MSKFLIAAGILLILLGIAWPLIQRSGLGRLPGDLVFRHENFVFYFPITTMILISVLITAIFWLMNR